MYLLSDTKAMFFIIVLLSCQYLSPVCQAKKEKGDKGKGGNMVVMMGSGGGGGYGGGAGGGGKGYMMPVPIPIPMMCPGGYGGMKSNKGSQKSKKEKIVIIPVPAQMLAPQSSYKGGGEGGRGGYGSIQAPSGGYGQEQPLPMMMMGYGGQSARPVPSSSAYAAASQEYAIEMGRFGDQYGDQSDIPEMYAGSSNSRLALLTPMAQLDDNNGQQQQADAQQDQIFAADQDQTQSANERLTPQRFEATYELPNDGRRRRRK